MIIPINTPKYKGFELNEVIALKNSKYGFFEKKLNFESL